MTPIFDIKELIALMRAGTSEEAIPHLEYITQKLPTHVAAHALLAQAYTNERRLEEARVAWQNALFLMPNSPSIKKGFRRVLKELYKQQHNETDPQAEEEQTPEHQTEDQVKDQDIAPALSEHAVDSEPQLENEHQETPNDKLEAELNGQSEDLDKQSEEIESQPEELDNQSEDLDSLPKDEDEEIGQINEKINIEELLDGAPSNSDQTPSLLINPSSHHNATPVEIEARATEETRKEDDPETEELNDFPLPIITVPTPTPVNSTSPDSAKGLPDIPVPPILAPLVENSEEWQEDQELDQLIQELESARIVPKPDHEHIELPALEDNIEDMVSETLARIYEGQKQYAKAAEMYTKLATLHPERAKKFEAKADELRALKSDNSDQVHEASSDES